jgi:hypothetical protein
VGSQSGDEYVRSPTSVIGYEELKEPLVQCPGGQIRAPFVLIFSNTYGLSSEAIRL